MNFYELLILAKSGDDLANEKILAMYQPLLTKESDPAYSQRISASIGSFLRGSR